MSVFELCCNSLIVKELQPLIPVYGYIVYYMCGLLCGFYNGVDGLLLLLNEYRLYWVIDFIHETAIDLFENYQQIMNEREIAVCKKFKHEKFVKELKNPSMPIPQLKMKIAVALYEVFKICRKLDTEDKEIVIENFNLNRIEK